MTKKTSSSKYISIEALLNEPPKKLVIIFNHISKTGGSTLSKALKSQFSNSFPLNGVEDYQVILEKVVKGDFKETSFIFGHSVSKYQKNLVSLLPDDVKVASITFLREPLERFISGLNYHKAKWQEEPDVEKFINSWENVYTKKLGAGSFSKALHYVENEATFVGLTSDYSYSFYCIAKLFGLKNKDYLLKTKMKKYSIESLNCDQENLFVELNKKDCDLFQAAKEKLDRLKRVLPPPVNYDFSFVEKEGSFVVENNVLNFSLESNHSPSSCSLVGKELTRRGEHQKAKLFFQKAAIRGSSELHIKNYINFLLETDMKEEARSEAKVFLQRLQERDFEASSKKIVNFLESFV